ncbi:DUF4398 domain-containing protein [Usitatibacter palustris]|uniref:DUF4398 domain-containing protein n=1 Tax=Usitatibacter palustris TaxID=2732487 RepID=A0A6M4H4N2_9PROT|nr:DUF4398 domain-containing protein [Usitatibacter palustris]QJR13663.1 hypothetical protein DSM104440_00449 [Usitatibacter palustris]
MKILLLAGAAVLAVGCASSPPPNDSMAVARKGVDRAAGTPETVQWSPTELDTARAKLAMAESAMSRKDYDLARRLADEAEADARLAEARAGARKNDAAFRDVNNALRGLRDEIARRPAG